MSGVHGPNVVEQAVGGILAFIRDFAWVRAAGSPAVALLLGRRDELKDSTVTVVGLGPIGRAIAERVAAFEVETIDVRYTLEKGGPPTR